MSANTEVLNKRNKGSSMVLSKAIDNLVDNALVYGCPNGGKNDIEIILDNTVAHFYVQDYGVGISPELITKALERFVLGTNTNGEGSGLGLSIEKLLLSCMMGELEPLSENQGTCVPTSNLLYRLTENS